MSKFRQWAKKQWQFCPLCGGDYRSCGLDAAEQAQQCYLECATDRHAEARRNATLRPSGQRLALTDE